MTTETLGTGTTPNTGSQPNAGATSAATAAPGAAAPPAATPGTGDAPAAATPGDTGKTDEGKTDTGTPLEGKTEEGKDDKSGKSKDEQNPNLGAPEKYEFKPQEGQSLDDDVMSAFGEAARELNLSQEGAQKVLDTVLPVMAERAAARHLALRDEWRGQSQSDKEFGGEALNVNLAIAKRAREQFGTPELTKLLEDTGLGDHPEVIRAFYKVGKAISEDTHVSATDGGKSQGRSHADRLYDNKPKA